MINASAIVTEELNRIEAVTGERPRDWLEEVADKAWKTWIEGNDCDVNSYELEIIANATAYIDLTNMLQRKVRNNA